jgi:hypothetical protein
MIGLCVAGCAKKPSGEVPAGEPVPTAAARPARPAGPSLSPDAEAQRQAVVVDTVGDTVDRFDQIIRQREQANRAAADIRETKAAQETPVEAAAVGEPKVAAPDADASNIEKLAAALRARRPIDPIPDAEAAPPVTANAASNGAIGVSDGPSVSQRSSTNAAGERIAASGSLTSGTGVEIQRDGTDAGSPDVRRTSSVDPMLAIQQKYVSRVAEDPRDLSAQLELQMLRFLKDEPVPAMNDLVALPAEDRELLAAVCDALSNFRSVVKAEPNPLNSEKARPFVEMAERIRTRADLTLSGLTLCTKVTDFGVYDKIEPLAFDAGEPKRFVVYCEVDGFLSQLNPDQAWETKLSLELRLYDAHGLQVWQVPAEETKDSSNRRRRDFFLVKLIQLPTTLPGGQYMMKASVRDLQANRIAQQTIQFKINPKEAVPR